MWGDSWYFFFLTKFAFMNLQYSPQAFSCCTCFFFLNWPFLFWVDDLFFISVLSSPCRVPPAPQFADPATEVSLRIIPCQVQGGISRGGLWLPRIFLDRSQWCWLLLYLDRLCQRQIALTMTGVVLTTGGVNKRWRQRKAASTKGCFDDKRGRVDDRLRWQRKGWRWRRQAVSTTDRVDDDKLLWRRGGVDDDRLRRQKIALTTGWRWRWQAASTKDCVDDRWCQRQGWRWQRERSRRRQGWRLR